MVEIKKCSICEPSFSCISNGDSGRLYFFERANEYHAEPESIYDCPIFRKSITFKEKEQPKLINQKTGEPYDKL